MRIKNNTATEGQLSWVKPVIVGSAIALVLISVFLSGVHDPEPAWGKLWMIRPLVIVPLAGAAGGLFYYFMQHLRLSSGLNKVLVIVLSLFVYVIGLWIGAVLGLDGTLWD